MFSSLFVINREESSDGATARRKKTRNALQGQILHPISSALSQTD